jgi:hypothetical protein
MIYTLRFDSGDETSLQKIWNQASHIITRHTAYKTKKGNLNFIFADDEIWNDYWSFYYITVPPLLTYALELCEAIFTSIVEIDTFLLLLNQYIRYNKYYGILSGKIKKETGEKFDIKTPPMELVRIFI